MRLFLRGAVNYQNPQSGVEIITIYIGNKSIEAHIIHCKSNFIFREWVFLKLLVEEHILPL